MKSITWGDVVNDRRVDGGGPVERNLARGTQSRGKAVVTTKHKERTNTTQARNFTSLQVPAMPQLNEV